MSRKQKRAWSVVLGLEALAFVLAIAIVAMGDTAFGVFGMALSGLALWRSWHLSGRGRPLPAALARFVRHLPLLLFALVGFVALLLSSIASFTSGRRSTGWLQVLGAICLGVVATWAASRFFVRARD